MANRSRTNRRLFTDRPAALGGSFMGGHVRHRVLLNQLRTLESDEEMTFAHGKLVHSDARRTVPQPCRECWRQPQKPRVLTACCSPPGRTTAPLPATRTKRIATARPGGGGDRRSTVHTSDVASRVAAGLFADIPAVNVVMVAKRNVSSRARPVCYKSGSGTAVIRYHSLRHVRDDGGGRTKNNLEELDGRATCGQAPTDHPL
jgi:hypothetical protein